MNFIKEALVRNQATSFHVYPNNIGRFDIKIVFIEKDKTVVQVNCGEMWSGDVKNIFAYTIVHKDNTSFNCTKMDPNMFLSKGKAEGVAETLGL